MPRFLFGRTRSFFARFLVALAASLLSCVALSLLGALALLSFPAIQLHLDALSLVLLLLCGAVTGLFCAGTREQVARLTLCVGVSVALILLAVSLLSGANPTEPKILLLRAVLFALSCFCGAWLFLLTARPARRAPLRRRTGRRRG